MVIMIKIFKFLWLITFYLTEPRWLLLCPHVTESTLCVQCDVMNGIKEQTKNSQGISKCVLLILFPQGGVGLFRSEWGMSITSIHDTTSFIIFKYHYVQSFIQYNTPAQPRKHWLYTNKISHFYKSRLRVTFSQFTGGFTTTEERKKILLPLVFELGLGISKGRFGKEESHLVHIAV